MHLEMERFKTLSDEFIAQHNLRPYINFAKELQEQGVDFNIQHAYDELLVIEILNPSMNLSLYIELALYKSRIQLLQRTYRLDTEIARDETLIQRDHHERRVQLLFNAFTRLVNFKK